MSLQENQISLKFQENIEIEIQENRFLKENIDKERKGNQKERTKERKKERMKE
jgi:hypothetical protein